MITQSINLNLIPGGVLPRINVSQYDQGARTLVFNLFNGATSFTVTGLSVYIVGTKADNTGFEYACTISGTSQVTCDITDQMTAFAGEVPCEIRILDGTDQLGTCNFILNVEPSALSDNTVISETDIPIIQNIPQYVSEAEGYKDLAHQWATYGSDSETPSATNNAKYWANQSQQYATGALQWKGSITFANIPTTGISQGDMYNVTDSFTTDSRFAEGSGIECPAGTNIIYDENGKWDLQNPPYEASQSRYDNTDSGLSATNTQSAIDEVNAPIFTSNDNTSIFNSGNLGGQSSYAWSAVAKLTSGEKQSSLFNKVSTMFKNIRTIAKLIGTTDISSIGDGTISGGLSTINSNLTEMFAVVSGTSPANTSIIVDYPNGFSQSNTNVICIIVDGKYVDYVNFGVSIESSNLLFYNKTSNNATYQIVLLKLTR